MKVCWVMNIFMYLMVILVGGLGLTEVSSVFAQPVSSNIDRHGIAIAGYDPVAYFEVGGGKPTKGDKAIAAEYSGATYRFVSDEHRDLFMDAPERFAPAYGGWCAFAMADGKKVEVNPKRFEVHDGRLFLFYRDWFTDTLKPWQEQRELLRAQADTHWDDFVSNPDDRSG